MTIAFSLLQVAKNVLEYVHNLVVVIDTMSVDGEHNRHYDLVRLLFNRTSHNSISCRLLRSVKACACCGVGDDNCVLVITGSEECSGVCAQSGGCDRYDECGW